jgi:MFS family permease
MAHFGDTRGRKRVFAFSLLLMAMPTLLIGILPTYSVMGLAAPMLLLVMRLLQGMAIGGEAPGAWVFVADFRLRKLPRAHGGFHFSSAGFSRSAQPCCAVGLPKLKRFVKCGSAREPLVSCL